MREVTNVALLPVDCCYYPKYGITLFSVASEDGTQDQHSDESDRANRRRRETESVYIDFIYFLDDKVYKR